MSLQNSLEQRQAFVQQFQELVGWSNLDVAATSPLATLFETVSDDTFPGAILPRPLEGEIAYYAIAESGRAWRTLAPLLKASVGVTLTDFVGLTTTLQPDDPVEAWLAGWNFAAIARFSPGQAAQSQAMTEASLLRLYDTLRLSEVRQSSLPRSTYQVLNDFRWALAAQDPHTAAEQITFLRTNLRLDALNLYFLEVQLEATFRRWERLFQKPFFRNLCDTRRPPGITTALVQAIYHTKIEPVEVADGPAAALAIFRSEVHGPYSNLFKICPPHPQPAVAKMFLLAAMAADAIDYQTIDTLAAFKANWSDEAAVQAYDQFLDLVPPAPPSTESLNKSPLANLSYALELTKDQSQPVTLAQAKAVLFSAIEAQSLEAYQTAIDYVTRLSEDDQTSLLTTPGYAGMWSEISKLATENHVPRNWVEWLELLPQMSHAQAQALSERSVDEWPIDQQLQYLADVQNLVDALNNLNPYQEDWVLKVLPNFLLWIRSDDHWPNRDYLPLYEQLLTVFFVHDDRQPNTLQACLNLLEEILLLGLNKEKYNEIMGYLGNLVQQLGTLHIDWLIDLAELTTLYACPDQVAQQNLLIQIISRLSYLTRQLSPSQLNILRDIATQLKIEDQITGLTVSEKPRPNLAASVRGFRVAIYTLTESVGQRAARELRTLYPGIKVDLSHEKVSSDRLVNLARRADLFIVCWRSAKHAATNAIDQNRSSDQSTILVSGTGSSGILAAIEEYLISTFAGGQND